jgi:multiple sugar transport system ATP-binding protein
VFLFDEPLSNLDAKLRTQMRLEIKRLRQRVPTTSVFVTHDQVEAMTLGDRVVVMKDGHIQQCGTPLQVYGEPSNKFVAGFIGAPSMNFIAVTIQARGDGQLTAVGAGLAVPVPAARREALAPWKDREVILGVRPEHLLLAQSGNGNGNGSGNGNGYDGGSIGTATVEVVEQLGSEIQLETRLGDAVVTVARIDPSSPLGPGDAVALAVLYEQVHFFDPQTEKAIR